MLHYFTLIHVYHIPHAYLFVYGFSGFVIVDCDIVQSCRQIPTF
jgi:hypothetical protein